MKKNYWLIIIAVVILGGVFWYVTQRPTYVQPDGVERPYKGRADAAVVVDEFADFECPACRQAAPILGALDREYGANIRINFKHFPLESIHAQAFGAALAAECANDQGKFWEMHDMLYERQSELGRNMWYSIAEDLQLDMEQFDLCYRSKAHADIVRADQRDGRSIGVQGTPTFFVNGEQVQTGQLDSVIRASLGLPAQE